MPIVAEPQHLDFLPDGCTPDDIEVMRFDDGRVLHRLSYQGAVRCFFVPKGVHPETVVDFDAHLCLSVYCAAERGIFGNA